MDDKSLRASAHLDYAPSAPRSPEAEPTTLKGWFRANGVQLVFIALAAAAVFRYLHPFDVFLAGFGLSFIIFIHELGHFAAAKLCDVHVKTFSIGFGPALPFCSYKYGETTYKLALIPLGGFVAMVGEGDGNNAEVGVEETDEQKVDPRNLKNKTVLQRMFIISAGVVMNVVLAACLFVAAYMHGVEESPGVIAQVESGGGAWKAGVHVGSEIRRINSRENPWFDDIPPIVFSTDRSASVTLDLDYRGTRTTVAAVPFKIEGGKAPMLGIAPPNSLELFHAKRDAVPPFLPGSIYAQAGGPDGQPGFLPGDKIVGMTDPANPTAVTPMDPRPGGMPGESFDYSNRQRLLVGKQVTYDVVRRVEGQSTTAQVQAPRTARLTVPPAFHRDLGLRMRMGEVTAVRSDSPAAKSELVARQPETRKTPLTPGDEIVAVDLPEADGRTTRYTTDATEAPPADAKVSVKPLDPVRLPFDLAQWAARPSPVRKVKLTVLRTVEHAPQRKTLDLDWDAAYADEIAPQFGLGTPIALNGLGLTYQVLAVVHAVEPFVAAERSLPADQRKTASPAARAGLLPNDKILQVKFQVIDHEGKAVTTKFEPVKPHQWPFVDFKLQLQAPHVVEVKYERDGQELTAELAADTDPTWPVPPLGLDFAKATVVQKADGVVDALRMGGYRTYRGIRTTYQSLYGLVFGDVSITSMSGPIRLTQISYLIAGQDVWHLLLWMAMISINLAVVNFMPIPVLDGGHMVFLIYEGVRGKPAPESVQVLLTYAGLACVLCLMLFVVGLDIWRLFFG